MMVTGTTQLASPDTGVATYTPDAAGNVIGATDARGVATSYTYDALNRPTLASFTGGSVAFDYDNTATGGAYAKGRLTRLTDPSGTTTYTYDVQGRIRPNSRTLTRRRISHRRHVSRRSSRLHVTGESL